MRVILLALLLQAPLQARAENAVEPLVLPFAADAFDVQETANGTLHALFARKGLVFYTRKAPEASSFEEALRVKGPAIQLGGMERKPMLALGKEGRLHVLWQTKTGLHYTVSRDRGRRWTSQPVRDRGAEGEIDMPALAAGPDGTVSIVWVDARLGHREGDDYGADLYLAQSDARGRLGPNRRLTADQPSACPCCQPAAVVDGQGRLWVAYRSSMSNIKESHLLIVTAKGVVGQQLSEHRWDFVGCPMAGPSLAVQAGKAAVVWTSDGSLFTAFSRDGGKTFSAAERLGLGGFHSAASNGRELLIAWDEGDKTGYRFFGQSAGERLPLAPKGKLLGTSEGFRLVSARRLHGHAR